MIDLSQAKETLERMGVWHAPLQADGRYVTLRDPAGVYYLLGTDNAYRPEKLEDRVQLLFLGVPPTAARYADAVGYKVEQTELLNGSTESIPVYSVMLVPRIELAKEMPDWPPRASALDLPDGERRHGSTGQLFEVRQGQWHRVPPSDAVATLTALRGMVSDTEVLVAKYAVEANQEKFAKETQD